MPDPPGGGQVAGGRPMLNAECSMTNARKQVRRVHCEYRRTAESAVRGSSDL